MLTHETSRQIPMGTIGESAHDDAEVSRSGISCLNRQPCCVKWHSPPATQDVQLFFFAFSQDVYDIWQHFALAELRRR